MSIKAHSPVLAVETVVCGDILRIVLDGLPELEADTPEKMLAELRDKHEDFRKFVIAPPRGHDGVSACLLLPSSSPDAVKAIAVAPQLGYVPFAGTPMMAASCVLLDEGAIDSLQAKEGIWLDTAKGPQQIFAEHAGGKDYTSHWSTSPARIIIEGGQIILSSRQKIEISIVEKGLPYVIVRAASLNIDVQDSVAASAAAVEISRRAVDAFPPAVYGLLENAATYPVLVTGEPYVLEDQLTVMLSWVSPSGWVANGPAGTGALSLATILYRHGELVTDQSLKVTSPKGNSLICRINGDHALLSAEVHLISRMTLY